MDNMKSKKTGNRKLLLIVIALAVVLVIVGIVAAVTGVFSGGGKSGSAKTADSSLLQAPEYKASAEYEAYLDGLSDEELDKVIDTSDEAIYEAPAKVKELCETYGLKYAAKATDLTSYEQVEKELEARKLSGFLGDELSKQLQTTMKEYDGGYVFDDGELYLEIEQEDEERGNVLLLLNITPKGVFPYQSSSFQAQEKDAAPQTVEDMMKNFTYQPKSGGDFICRTQGPDGTAFGKAGDYYITMAMTREPSDAKSEEYEKAVEKLDEKVKKAVGIDSLDELEEKVYSGIQTAWEKEPDAMQEALDNDDKQQYQALQDKYTTTSKEELALYEECKKELEPQEVYVTEQDLQDTLNKLDFSKFV
ncbi:MAG: hypothetical protein SOR93_03070 [Clostridiales Family XIII bacterium]|nr:hypothetical protein [Clostridia bacterium]MDY3010228.1 hypothetical protein [Clostridiales Family XIII bacterium]